MNVTNIKAIVISFITSNGSRHEFEIQITKKPASSASPGNNHQHSPEKKFSHERLTVKEVAERLRVHPWTVYMWARQGRLPCIRESKRTLRFLKSDIDKYEKLHTSGRIR